MALHAVELMRETGAAAAFSGAVRGDAWAARFFAAKYSARSFRSAVERPRQSATSAVLAAAFTEQEQLGETNCAGWPAIDGTAGFTELPAAMAGGTDLGLAPPASRSARRRRRRAQARRMRSRAAPGAGAAITSRS